MGHHQHEEGLEASVLIYTVKPRVVILGGGFAGLYTAQSLGNAPVQVTLVDRRNHHLFQPMLYQVATAALAQNSIASPIRSILRDRKNVDVLLGEATAVDPGIRAIRLSDGTALEYDYLVVATGARHSYFGKDQWESLAPGLKSLEDAEEMAGGVDAGELRLIPILGSSDAIVMALTVFTAERDDAVERGEAWADVARWLSESFGGTLEGQGDELRARFARQLLCSELAVGWVGIDLNIISAGRGRYGNFRLRGRYFRGRCFLFCGSLLA